MTIFDRIPEDAIKDADVTIKSIAGTGPRTELEVMPGFESIVTFAALALERGQPNTFSRARETKAEDLLRQYGHENRSFQNAVARVIHMHRTPGSGLDPTPEGVMRHIAVDVVNQSSMQRVEMAVKDRHTAFETGFSKDEMRRLERARDYAMHAKDVRHESYGNYSELSTAGKDNLIDTFADAAGLTDATTYHLVTMARAVEGMKIEQAANARTIDYRLAEFHDFHKPLFPDVAPGGADRAEWSRAADRVEELVAGAVPRNVAEAGVVTHVAVAGAREDDHVTRESRMHALVGVDAGGAIERVAITIEAEALAIRDARHRQFQEIDDITPLPDHVDAIANRQYRWMEPVAQVGHFKAIRNGDRVPVLTMMKMSEAARLVERDVEKHMDASVKRSQAPGMTHERKAAAAMNDLTR
jgi:hypothetical protein